MLKMKFAAVTCLLCFTLIANAEQISGRAEFIAFDDVPEAGLLVGETGLITFGIESEDGSVVAGMEYRVKAAAATERWIRKAKDDMAANSLPVVIRSVVQDKNDVPDAVPNYSENLDELYSTPINIELITGPSW